jgi:hypothetical protein
LASHVSQWAVFSSETAKVSSLMQLHEIAGYGFAILAIVLAAGGVWAARYYSPMRSYGRMRKRERKALRERERERPTERDE